MADTLESVAQATCQQMSPICQTKPSQHDITSYLGDDQETDSVSGYRRFGRQWFSTLVEANKLTNRHFQWAVNLNFPQEWTAETIGDLIRLKAKLMKNLGSRKETSGLAGHWRLQINEVNRQRVHFHILLLDGLTDDIERVRAVIDKAIKPLKCDGLRTYVEAIHCEYAYLAYVHKFREKDRSKIVLWAKGLPKFTRVGTFRYPWPTEWRTLPAVSATYQGGHRRRFLKSRRTEEKAVTDTLSQYFPFLCPQFISHIRSLTGKSTHDIRHMLASDPGFWETQMDSWIGQASVIETVVQPFHKMLQDAEREYLQTLSTRAATAVEA
jgi:hypothetical protein